MILKLDTVILGDTYDSETLLLPSKGADVVVHECTILEEDASEAVKRYHSTASEFKRENFSKILFFFIIMCNISSRHLITIVIAMAGHFARAIDARCLVLTHFSCKFEVNFAYDKTSSFLFFLI